MSPLGTPSSEARSLQLDWPLVAADLGADGQLGPSALIARVVNAATPLIRGSATRVDVNDLEVRSVIRAGTVLSVRVVLERVQASHEVVSVVVRDKISSERGSVVALGSLRFESQAAGRRRLEPVPEGRTPVGARFRADHREPLRGAVGRWLQDTALVSAQGYVGGPVRFGSVVGLTILRGIELGQALSLECAVVGADAGHVEVVTQLRDDHAGEDVVCALTRWKIERPLASARWFRSGGPADSGRPNWRNRFSSAQRGAKSS